VTFAGLIVALDRVDLTVRIEGDGEVQDDGSVRATSIEAETDEGGQARDDDDDDDDDDGDNDDDDGSSGSGVFEGLAAFVDVMGDAPARTLRVELGTEGSAVMLDIMEASTAFESDGDVVTFASLLAALDRADVTVRIEGDGERRDDGSFLATSIKVETDEEGHDTDDDDDPAGLTEFRGVASLLEVSGVAPSRTARVRVGGDHDTWLVTLVEGTTEFDGSGDFHSVGSVLAAFAQVGLVVSLEGEGVAQSNGTVLATTVRAEVE
jgi:hypothetical protein